MFYKIKIRKAHSYKWAENPGYHSEDGMIRDVEQYDYRTEVRDGVMLHITRMEPSEKDVQKFWDGIEFIKENRQRMPHIEFTAPESIEIRLVEAGEEVSVHCSDLNAEDSDFLVRAPRGMRGWRLDKEVSFRYDRANAFVGDAFRGPRRFGGFDLIRPREIDTVVLAEIEKILSSSSFFDEYADERYSHVQEEEEIIKPEVKNDTLGDVFGDLLNQMK